MDFTSEESFVFYRLWCF